ncbi:hypothetical protein [Bacillus sinesaloumensis]|uniref:hypothetical protein n=1 Tax=Litchfieldia sinesaloumensis TaxID=1926280 RepID=UPI001F16E30C|nr:hypothetical protein [Bacillus sinesaloumensis]
MRINNTFYYTYPILGFLRQQILGNEKMAISNEITESKTIPYRLIEQKEETDNVVIILPGTGDTAQAPLKHIEPKHLH